MNYKKYCNVCDNYVRKYSRNICPICKSKVHQRVAFYFILQEINLLKNKLNKKINILKISYDSFDKYFINNSNDFITIFIDINSINTSMFDLKMSIVDKNYKFSKKFDLIICLDVLDYVYEKDIAIKNLYNNMHKDSILILNNSQISIIDLFCEKHFNNFCKSDLIKFQNDYLNGSLKNFDIDNFLENNFIKYIYYNIDLVKHLIWEEKYNLELIKIIK